MLDTKEKILESNFSKQLLNTDSKDKWRRIGTHKRAGVLVPLFSVYSERSVGIGELPDLKLLIDWAKDTGNSIIQLLPMNELGAIFCPYDSLSSFALEPMYISLGDVKTATETKPAQEQIENLKRLFPPGRAYVDYGIKEAKIRVLREIFFQTEPSNLPEFAKFKEENSYWLFDFALYKELKAYHRGGAWYEWDMKYRERDKGALQDFQREHKKEINFQMWVQWQLFGQFRDVKTYAKTKNVLLKGDLPILVSRDSADVWQHPEYFKLEFAAGAPPDMYCAKGQRWGMPTYNWEKIEADGFRYLKEKLKYAENFYDILRIDHVVGIFRIWSIPYEEPLENMGLNGFFDPRNESEWLEHGKSILSTMAHSTGMLLCAEDLGVIPKACPVTLAELGIPGNDVQRWTKDWKIKHDFLEPSDYRALSVAMLSTHDTTNWPAWWENEAGTVDEGLFIRKCSDQRQINFNSIKDKLFDPKRSGHGRLRWQDSVDTADKLVTLLGKRKEELADFIDLYQDAYREKEKLWKHLEMNGPMREKSDPEIVKAALKISLDTSAIFCINTIIDWLYLTDLLKGDPYQYRTNTPGTTSDKNWSLVLPLSLDQLLKHKVGKEIRAMIKSSGRSVKI